MPRGPARIGGALAQAGLELHVVRSHLREAVPEDAAAYAAVVVMGGPMSAATDDGFPSRRSELALLRSATAHRVPTLGVCLGAQLLAASAGATVRAMTGPEIGWGTVELTDAAADDMLLRGLPSPLPVLHWHGETFDLPAGALLLATTPVCAHQAFRIGPSAWGLQFHAEVDAQAVAALVTAFPGDAIAAGGTNAVLNPTGDRLAALAPAQAMLTERFAALASAAQG
jgi:GMP synthase-like glutamine amidotransferase